jgi:hypothetical protein
MGFFRPGGPPDSVFTQSTCLNAQFWLTSADGVDCLRFSCAENLSIPLSSIWFLPCPVMTVAEPLVRFAIAMIKTRDIRNHFCKYPILRRE